MSELPEPVRVNPETALALPARLTLPTALLEVVSVVPVNVLWEPDI